MHACSVTQSCPSLCDPMDCSPPDSVHGIFQARILEWVTISCFRGSSQLRDWTCVSCVSCIGRWILYHWTSWEAVQNWCFWTGMLEKTLESPLGCRDIKPVNPKEKQPWIFIERTDAKALILWPPDAKSRLIGKDTDAGKDWRQEEKGMTEGKLVGWHHQLNGHEFEQAPGTWWRTGKFWHAAVQVVTKSWTWLSDWTTAKVVFQF